MLRKYCNTFLFLGLGIFIIAFILGGLGFSLSEVILCPRSVARKTHLL